MNSSTVNYTVVTVNIRTGAWEPMTYAPMALDSAQTLMKRLKAYAGRLLLIAAVTPDGEILVPEYVS